MEESEGDVENENGKSYSTVLEKYVFTLKWSTRFLAELGYWRMYINYWLCVAKV